MQAVVKTPHIEISIRGAAIPPKLINVLREEYGKKLSLVEDQDEKFIDVFETKWFKSMKSKMTPGVYIRICRKKKGLTQRQLGEALGGIPAQNISGMERGTRAISLAMAQKLSAFFQTGVEKFIAGTTEGAA
jgi:DNA-binding XRE family transcriptional regulator